MAYCGYGIIVCTFSPGEKNAALPCILSLHDRDVRQLGAVIANEWWPAGGLSLLFEPYLYVSRADWPDTGAVAV